MDYIYKDITTVEAPAIILHGVNCQREMGSGVAQALYSKWPLVKEEYMKFSKEEMQLGKIASFKVDNNLYAINCWTQEQYGYDNTIYASVEAIKTCLEHAVQICTNLGIYNIFSPRIGCGLGGLSWENDVQPIFAEIEQKYPSLNITICDWDAKHEAIARICYLLSNAWRWRQL